jgi:spore coat protein CotF
MAQASGQNQTGQQSQQGQMTGQGMQFSDRDILQLCLNEEKHLACSLNTYIQEASSEQLRRDYMTVLGDIYSQEKQLFDFMQQKGFYNVKNASPQDISQAQNKFASKIQQQGMQ